MNDAETRLRSADPLGQITPEQLDQDHRWLQERISATGATPDPVANHARQVRGSGNLGGPRHAAFRAASC